MRAPHARPVICGFARNTSPTLSDCYRTAITCRSVLDSTRMCQCGDPSYWNYQIDSVRYWSDISADRAYDRGSQLYRNYWTATIGLSENLLSRIGLSELSDRSRYRSIGQATRSDCYRRAIGPSYRTLPGLYYRTIGPSTAFYFLAVSCSQARPDCLLHAFVTSILQLYRWRKQLDVPRPPYAQLPAQDRHSRYCPHCSHC